MDISFKGFRNTGIGVDINKESKQILKGNLLFKRPKYVHLTLSTTLNDVGEKDLSTFGEILRKFPNDCQKNTIIFHYDKYFVESLNKTKKEFWLNYRPLVLNDANLPIFSKLSQLFSKLSKTPDSELKMGEKYLDSFDCKSNFSYFAKGDAKKILQEIHNPENVRKSAKDMCDEFQKIMIDYFNP